MSGPVPGRNVVPNTLVKTHQAHSVALPFQEQPEARSQCPRIVPLAVTHTAKPHGPAAVHQQMAAQVCLVLKTLDEMTVTPCQHLPVEIPQVIAGAVLPVFRKLYGKAVIGTAMQPTPKTLNHRPGTQLQTLDPHQYLGIKRNRPLLGRSPVHHFNGSSTESNTRRMTSSTPTPSASAR